MAFVTITCPQCGGQAQIEAGRSVMCPYCGREISAPAADMNYAFAPAPDMQQPVDVQFSPPPAQYAPQPAADPAQFTASSPQQYAAPVPQYDPRVLAEAQQKRKNWYFINSSMIVAQTMMFALGILFTVKGYRIGVPLILTWVLTLFGFGAVSGMTRPDEAYIEKKPFSKNRFLAGITQFWLGAAISSAVGGILFAILAGLLGMY